MVAVSTLNLHNGLMPHSVARWGNSLALRIPSALAKDAGLAEGTPVTVRLEGGALVIRADTPSYTLDEVLQGLSKKNRHPETPTGRARGREVW